MRPLKSDIYKDFYDMGYAFDILVSGSYVFSFSLFLKIIHTCRKKDRKEIYQNVNDGCV